LLIILTKFKAIFFRLIFFLFHVINKLNAF
jgi:hypothetical protein